MNKEKLIQDLIVDEGLRLECCHNDGNPENNYLENLRWDTHQSNIADSLHHGTRSKPPVHRGETHPKATLTDVEVAKIRATPITRGVKAMLSRKYSVSQTTVTRILTNRTRLVQHG